MAKAASLDFKKAKPKAEVVRPATYDGRLVVHLCISHVLCHLRHAELAKHLQKYKRKSHDPGGQQRRIQSSSIHRARSVSLSNGGSKVSGHNFKTHHYGWRSQRRGTTIYASTGVGRSQIAEIVGERMPTSMDTTTTTQSMKETKGQSFTWDETFTVIRRHDCVGKKDWKEFA